MKIAFFSALACLIVCCIAFNSPAHIAQSDLAALLQQAANRRQEYVETFKDLTAVESKTTELFDKNGKSEVDKRSLRLSGRITYSYDAFKRFEVRADSEVPKLPN